MESSELSEGTYSPFPGLLFLGIYFAGWVIDRILVQSFIAVQITYFTNAVFTKASLLILYHRVFGVVTGFRWALWISGAIITSYFIACVIASVAGCDPVSYFWDKDQPGSCIDEVNFFRWNGIVNLLLDVLVLSLPFPMTWRVKTSIRQKLILSGIFALGGL